MWDTPTVTRGGSWYVTKTQTLVLPKEGNAHFLSGALGYTWKNLNSPREMDNWVSNAAVILGSDIQSNVYFLMPLRQTCICNDGKWPQISLHDFIWCVCSAVPLQFAWWITFQGSRDSLMLLLVMGFASEVLKQIVCRNDRWFLPLATTEMPYLTVGTMSNSSRRFRM